MRILHFADLHLGVESYGHTDPTTGLSSRFADFLASFDRVADYALSQGVDLVLFCGDAYKSRDPSQTQQREFAQRIKRIVSAGIPVFLLVGNHDLPNALGKATTMEIFHTLEVGRVKVANRPDLYRVETRAGVLQVVALPWLSRSALLRREDSRGLTFEQLNEKLREILTNILQASIAQFDPALPSLLAAHVWVYGARQSSERMLTLSRDHFLQLGDVAHTAFDYVALGHIHRHQVMSHNPPVVYAGSLERLDFSEEADEKGFCVVEIPGKGQATFEFHKLPARRFLTLEVDIKSDDSAPTATVLQAIARRAEEVKDAIVRLRISLPAHFGEAIQENEVRKALREAYYVAAIVKDVPGSPRARLGGMPVEKITPLEALKAYLQTKKTSPERSKILLDYGERLMRGEEE